jgi:hypothetical protein
MHAEEPPNTPPTEGQTIPPEEQIIPTAGLVQDDEQPQGEEKAQGMADKVKEAAPESMSAATDQAKSLAQQNPTPIVLAATFVAGIVIGRMASRWG